MRQFQFNERKALNAVLYVLNQMNGRADMHKLFKILYFADQKHLVNYGRPVVGDEYIKLNYGPVPYNIYYAVGSIRSNSQIKCFELFKENLTVKGMFLLSNNEPDLDELSSSDIKCIDESIFENKDLSFDALVDKSHGKAYDSSKKSERIKVIAIAQEGGANEDQVKYIYENMMDLSHFIQHVSS